MMKCFTILSVAVVAITLLMVPMGASAATITYVDASTTNTTIDGNAIVVNDTVPPGNVTSTRTASDNLWAFETNATFGTNSNSVFASNVEDSGTLATTVSGLASGTYEVWAFYWDVDDGTGGGDGWDITAQVGVNAAVTAAGDVGGTVASTLTYVSDPSFAEGNRRLMAVSLGQVVGTGFTVTVDDPAGNGRTWYDGVGYEPVPEPGTFSLASLALLGSVSLRLRRRKR